jgi:capsid portal protein
MANDQAKCFVAQKLNRQDAEDAKFLNHEMLERHEMRSAERLPESLATDEHRWTRMDTDGKKVDTRIARISAN